MENLDEFMRHKFNSEESEGRFEFREEYWEQAQALIELNEASRKKQRRWLLFWWVSGLILLAGAWGLWETGSELFRNKNGQEAAIEVAASGHATALPTVPNPTSGKDRHNADSQKGPANNTPEAKISHLNERDTENEVISTANQAEHNNLGAGPKGAISLLRRAEKAPLGTVLPDITNKTRFESGATVVENANSASEFKTLKTGSAETPTSTVKEPADASSNSSWSDITPNTTINTTFPGQRLKGFDLLSLPEQLLAVNPKMPQPSFVANFVSQTPVKVKKDKRLRFGIEAFASSFIFDKGAMRRGGGAGVFAERAFQKHWSVTGGVRYRFIPNPDALQDPDIEGFTSQIRYSFGAQYIEQKRDITGFHTIELPLGAQWHTGRLALSVFGAPGIVLGALGKVTKSSKSSLPYAADYNKAESDLYFSSNLYRRFSISAGTGIEWEAFSGLSLCAQVQYFRGMTKISSDGTKVNGFENINVGVKYRF